jgi:ubiquinone/menaquinone biosynthesis C-methylase UbiE
MLKVESENTARRGLRQRLFAWMHANESAGDYDRIVDPYKRALLKKLSGTVLEIGAGAGDNFPYFPSDIHWIGIEPNAFMHPHLLEAAKHYNINGELSAATAEHLPQPDSSVDAVVSTLVLCSVSDQAQVLKEILRVLKPGGKYVFVEHVIAPEHTGERRMQKLIKPLWRTLADGCEPDRDTAAAVRRAGFSSVEITSFETPLWLASPHIAGTAVK